MIQIKDLMKNKNIFGYYNHITGNACIYKAFKRKLFSNSTECETLYNKNVTYKTFKNNLNKFYKLENA